MKVNINKQIIDDLLNKEKLDKDDIILILNHAAEMNKLDQDDYIKEIAAKSEYSLDIVKKYLKDIITDKKKKTKIEENARTPLKAFDVNPEMLDQIFMGINPQTAPETLVNIMEAFVEKNPIWYDTETKIWWLWDETNFKWRIGCDIEILRIFKNKYGFVAWLMGKLKYQLLVALQTVAQNKPKPLPVEWIQFKEEAINIKTGEIQKPTPEYFFTNPIGWNIGISEDTPIMDKLFDEWVGADNVELLYELISYSLLRAYPIARMFFLVGSGRNGKTTFMKMLTTFIGEQNRISTDFKRMKESRFESAKLMNKLICEISETSADFLKDTAQLKALTGESYTSGEIKNKEPFEFMNFAKIIISTNHLPISEDLSAGFFRRAKTINFPNEFEEKMDILAQIPDEEYENLAKKCVRILYDLIKRGKFHGETTIEARRLEYESMSNPLAEFITKKCERKIDGFVIKTHFVGAFQKYLIDIDFYRRFTPQDINKTLRFMGYELGKKRNVNDENPRWAVLGLELKEQYEITTTKTNSKNKKIDGFVPSVPENRPFSFSSVIRGSQVGKSMFLEQKKTEARKTPQNKETPPFQVFQDVPRCSKKGKKTLLTTTKTNSNDEKTMLEREKNHYCIFCGDKNAPNQHKSGNKTFYFCESCEKTRCMSL